MATLDLIVLDREKFLESRLYIAYQVLDRVARRGVRVRLVDRLDMSPASSAAFLHIDQTMLPPPFLWAGRVYDRCLNAGSLSIARDRYSTARVYRDTDFAGPVIVKSILNHRGLAEFAAAVKEERFAMTRPIETDDLRSELQRRLCAEYGLFESKEAVPEETWTDASLIVERFVPGRLAPPIVKYRHEFLLELELNTRAEFATLNCDPESMTDLAFLPEAPAEVHETRRRLGLDYGSIDYFVIDGQVTVIDVNRTTTCTPSWIKAHPELGAYFEALADRLRAYAADG